MHSGLLDANSYSVSAGVEALKRGRGFFDVTVHVMASHMTTVRPRVGRKNASTFGVVILLCENAKT